MMGGNIVRRRWIGLILLIVIVGGIYLWSGADHNSQRDSEAIPEQSQTEIEKKLPQKEISDALLKVYSIDQTTRLKLKAEKMIQTKGEDELQLKNISLEVYKKDKPEGKEKVKATLIAAHGRYFPKAGKLKFAAPLSLLGNGIEVKADKLDWNRSENRWYGEGDVQIVYKSDNIKLTGERFIADVDLDRLKVKEDVRLERLNQKAGDGADVRKDE
jgi:lipopolysaccharide assembly outer membrane protein LptD (OstA)